MIIQFLVSMLACLSFAILFCAPRNQCIYCALTGAAGWLSYLLLEPAAGAVAASLLATFLLTILSRIFAAARKNPVTLYLVIGIFPLVPGAGIYYTSYYFIMNDMTRFAVKGMETFKIAGAIALGIIFALAIPQSLFHIFQRAHK
ncbi:MAG: threonine/serine exporter family protein [Lachnospiraceae bacterium]|nr:threonine/serine exporter family protein [Lachnospiraceae bacterium]